MITQLNPPIPLSTPKGDGLAWLVMDYGPEHHLMWAVAIDETGEIWTFQNPEVRAQKNVTMNRELGKKQSSDQQGFCKPICQNIRDNRCIKCNKFHVEYRPDTVPLEGLMV